jgi:hypothetical protein
MNVKNKIPKTVKTKTYLASLILVSLIFLSTIAYVASNGGFNPPDIYLDDLPSTVEYAVSTDGSYCWATRYDGKIGFYGTNFATVMTSVITELYGSGTGTGGSIRLRAGAYYTSTTIDVKPGIHIWGEGRGGSDDYTKLSTVIFATADISIFRFDFPTQGYHSGLHLLFLDGLFNVATKGIVDVTCSNGNVGDIFLEDLSIIRGKYGIRLSNSHASNRIWNVFIERCFIEQCSSSAILLDSSTNQQIFQCRILANHFFGNNFDSGNGAIEIDGHETRGGVISENTFELEQRNAIYMTDEADGWTISNNVIIDAGQGTTNTYSGIKLVNVDYISITGNIVINRASNKMKYGYEADNDCSYLAVFGNVFKGQSGGASYGSGTGNKGSDTDNCVETG